MRTQRFSTVLADTSAARQIHHHIRYRVYCERKAFEKGHLQAGIPQEQDRFDRFASRFLVRDNTLQQWRGTARLIANWNTCLPVQALQALDADYTDDILTRPTAEVSRLAMVPGASSRSDTCPMLQSVITALLGYSDRYGIEHLIFLISPGLRRVLERLGIPMVACGPRIDHRGIRQAFCTDVTYALEYIPWVSPAQAIHGTYRIFSSEIEERHPAASADALASNA